MNQRSATVHDATTSPRVMRLLLWAVCAALLAAPRLAGQPLVFDSTSVNFGPALQGMKLSHVFRFINMSEDTIVIGEAHSSCSCAAAVLTNPVVAPGARGSVLVEYLPLYGLLGETEKTILLPLTSPCGAMDPVALRIRATMEAEVRSMPEALHCVLIEGVADTIAFVLESQSPDTLQILSRSAAFMQYAHSVSGGEAMSSPYTKFDLLASIEPLAPGQRRQCRLVLHGEVQAKISGSIRFALPHSDLRIAVTAEVRSIRAP